MKNNIKEIQVILKKKKKKKKLKCGIFMNIGKIHSMCVHVWMLIFFEAHL